MIEGETQHLSLKGKHGTHLIEALVVGVGLTSFMFFLCPWMVRLVPAGPDSRLWWNGWSVFLEHETVEGAVRTQGMAEGDMRVQHILFAFYGRWHHFCGKGIEAKILIDVVLHDSFHRAEHPVRDGNIRLIRRCDSAAERLDN